MKATRSFSCNRALNQMLSLATGLAIVLAGAPGAAFAQERSTSPQQVPVKTSATQAARAQSGGQQEGIKVHGDWTITVRNPDGTVAARHEFKNALAAHLGGDRVLAPLLAGVAVGGQFTVALFTTPVAACNANNAPCQITESNSPNASNSRDLVKSVPATGPDAGKLVLTGTIRIPANATISTVQTDLTTCVAAVAPASCVSAQGVGFTQKSLSPAVSVIQNQIVEVKIVVSFS